MKIVKLSSGLSWIRCHLFGFHDWTSDLKKRGGKPMEGLDTPEKISTAFINDCKLYCNDCGHQSELNKKLDDILLEFNKVDKK